MVAFTIVSNYWDPIDWICPRMLRQTTTLYVSGRWDLEFLSYCLHTMRLTITILYVSGRWDYKYFYTSPNDETVGFGRLLLSDERFQTLFLRSCTLQVTKVASFSDAWEGYKRPSKISRTKFWQRQKVLFFKPMLEYTCQSTSVDERRLTWLMTMVPCNGAASTTMTGAMDRRSGLGLPPLTPVINQARTT